MLYATTDKFLRVFGLNSLADLPETEAMLPDPEIGEQLSISMATEASNPENPDEEIVEQ